MTGAVRARAAVLERAAGPLTLVDDLEVAAPGLGEVRVRVAACGLCHSDLTAIDLAGTPGRAAPPLVVGHEAAGVVDAVGPGVTSVAVGDHVVLSPIAPCGTCYWCTRGQASLCVDPSTLGEAMTPDGTTHLSRGGTPVRAFGPGAFAERAVVAATSVVAIPRDVPLDVACVIGCAVQTGVGAVINTAEVPPGATVLVLGLGGVGMCVVQGARLAGASVILAADPVAERRVTALELDATAAVDPTTTDVLAVAHDLTDGVGMDFAFDAVGTGALVELGLQAIRRGGTMTCVGGAYDDITISPGRSLMYTEKKLQGCLLGSCNPRRDVPRLLRMAVAGHLDLEALITARRPLAEVNEAIADLRDGRGIRTVLLVQ